MNGQQNIPRVLMRVRITFGIAHLHVNQWSLTWNQDIGSGQGYHVSYLETQKLQLTYSLAVSGSVIVFLHILPFFRHMFFQ